MLFRSTKRIIGGHQRIKHLDPAWSITKREHQDKVGTVALGEIETPFGLWQYREVDWPEKKEIAANIAANQHGGEFDYPKFKDLIVEIDDSEFDLDLIGFDKNELSKIFEIVEDEPVVIIEDTSIPKSSLNKNECPKCGYKWKS